MKKDFNWRSNRNWSNIFSPVRFCELINFCFDFLFFYTIFMKLFRHSIENMYVSPGNSEILRPFLLEINDQRFYFRVLYKAFLISASFRGFVDHTWHILNVYIRELKKRTIFHIKNTYFFKKLLNFLVNCYEKYLFTFFFRYFCFIYTSFTLGNNFFLGPDIYFWHGFDETEIKMRINFLPKTESKKQV